MASTGLAGRKTYMLMQSTVSVRNLLKKLFARIFVGRSSVHSRVAGEHMQVRLPDASSHTSWVARSGYQGVIVTPKKLNSAELQCTAPEVVPHELFNSEVAMPTAKTGVS
jgi:hypothetical protein